MPPCDFCDECRADVSDYGGRLVCVRCKPKLFAGVAAALEGAEREARDEALRQEGRQQGLRKATDAAVAFFRAELSNHEGDAEDLLLKLIDWFERGYHLRSKEGT